MGHISREQILKYIPWDKTWIGTMAMLDLTRGFPKDIANFLDSQDPKELGGDFRVCRQLVDDWPARYHKPLYVGQSGKFLRFVRFYNWLNGIEHEPIITDTLKEGRIEKITNDPSIVSLPPEQLATLDFHTTQWSSIQYTLTPPALRRKLSPSFHQGKTLKRSADFKLRVTYDANDHWDSQRAKGEIWQPRKDPTFFNQTVAFIESLKTGNMCYIGEQAEDYCLESAFNLVSEEEGRLIYPSVEGHESNRFKEMRELKAKFERTGIIESKDHRAVFAMVMKAVYDKKPYEVRNSESVNKTWPQFFNCVDYILDNI